MATKDEINALKRDILEGIQILVEEGVLNGMGHLSVKVPGTNTFLINPRYAPNLAELEDISAVDLDSWQRVDGPGPIPGETAIHAGIYATHPEATVALHCHPRWCVLMSLIGAPVIPFSLESKPFANGVPTYPESHQVDTRERGLALGQAMGDNWVAFQRGHGIAAAGVSIAGIVKTAIQLEHTCEDQLTLMRFTVPQRLDDPAEPLTNAPLGEDYRQWPFLKQVHKTRPFHEIKASVPVPGEKEAYASGKPPWA